MTRPRRNPFPCLLAAMAFQVFATASHAQSIGGRVIDAVSGTGIAHAEITAVQLATDHVRRVTADSAGAFSFEVPTPGRYRLTVGRAGYHSQGSVVVDVSGREPAEVIVRLSPSALPLDTITARARGVDPRHLGTWEGFLARHASRQMVGPAMILRSDDLEFRSAFTVESMISRVPRTRGGGCLRVLVDGWEQTGWSRDNVLALSPHYLVGVEYYRNPLYAPLEYRDGTACPILAIWRTRPGRS